MKIALDFDNTYTADRTLWELFIGAAEGFGHKVYLVTMRCPIKDGIHPDWMPTGVTVIWCDGQPKRQAVAKQGVKIDVWIDDDPHSLVHGSQLSPTALTEWRSKDVYGSPEAIGEGRPNAQPATRRRGGARLQHRSHS